MDIQKIGVIASLVFSITSIELYAQNLPPVRILSVDGGGVRGIIPGVILSALEKKTGKPVTELFDVMVGTSTGALLVLFLNIPNSQGKQKLSAQQVIEVYKTISSKIFTNSPLRTVRTLGGVIGAKYSVKPFESLLGQYFGRLKMSDTVGDVIITSLDTTSNALFSFTTMSARSSNLFNRFMWEAARASCAAPTYFKPFELDLGGWAKLTLIDGGVGANNPGILGMIEAKKRFPNREYVLVSLGTGKSDTYQPIASKGNLAGGIVHMLKPLITGLFSSQAQLSDQAVQALIGKENFFRIDANLKPEEAKMDNANPKNLGNLENIGRNVVEQNANFRRLVEHLLAPPSN